MKITARKGMLSAIVSVALLLGGTAPVSAAEPCTFPNGGIGADASGCDFEGRDLFNVVFTGANFSNANLLNVVSRYSYWSEVNFANANLSNIIFYGANLADADFNGANLSGANLASSNVEGTDLSQATLTGVISGGLTGTPILPAGWIISGGYLIGPGANLQGANLSGVDLTGADLTGANLSGVRSGGILGTPIALPSNYGLYGGYLIGPGVDLSGAKLDGLAIWGANLSFVNLTGASINQTALNNTTSFEGVRSGGLVGTIQNINGAKVVDGYIVTSKANLAGADLRGADLSNLGLQQCNLTGADLTEADLSGSNLTGAVLVNTNFTFANLTSAEFGGNSISFSKFNGAKLTSAGFAQTEILASEFYQTDLTDTNFFGSVLLSTRSGDIYGEPAILPEDVQIIDGEITRVFTQLLSPVVAGLGQTGQTIEAVVQSTPEGATVDYQWLRDGEPIQGANTRTYLVTAKDVNKALTVRTTLTKRSIQTLVEISAPFAVAKGNIVPGTVNISGVMKAGKIIKAITRPWVNTVGVKSKYQWYRNGVAIKYATKSTYKLLPTDSKQQISVIVTQSLEGYNSASKQSPKRKVS